MKGLKYFSYLLILFLLWNGEASSHLMSMWQKAYKLIPAPPGDSTKVKKKEQKIAQLKSMLEQIQYQMEEMA